MTELFRCDVCGKEYKTKESCLGHEKSHFKDMDALSILKIELKNKNKLVCDYCINAYYVYGCEFDCEFKRKCNYSNNWSKFKFDSRILGYLDNSNNSNKKDEKNE